MPTAADLLRSSSVYSAIVRSREARMFLRAARATVVKDRNKLPVHAMLMLLSISFSSLLKLVPPETLSTATRSLISNTYTLSNIVAVLTKSPPNIPINKLIRLILNISCSRPLPRSLAILIERHTPTLVSVDVGSYMIAVVVCAAYIMLG